MRLDPASGAWMRKAQFGGVQELPAQSRHGSFAGVQSERGSIQGVSNQRVLQRGEVHPDLMGSSGVQVDCEECGWSEIR